MKLKLTAAALLAMGAFAGAAQAQSSVTLYGIVDQGLLYNSNVTGGKLWAVSTATSSRWGLKGTEDLGGGLQTIFDIENGFTAGTGALSQGGLEFGRKSFVGLTSNTLGTVTVGRQYSVSNDFTSGFASGADWAASGLGYGTHAGDVDNVDTSNRIQNSVKYETAVYNGLQFGALYSFGGTAGNVTKNQVYDLGAAYANGPIKLGVGYSYTKDPYYATFGDQGNSSTSSTGTNDNINNKIFGGYASAGGQQIFVAGGSYTIGAATIGLEYSNTQFLNLGSVATGAVISGPKYVGGSATFNSGEINLKYQLSPALLLAGAYIYTHNSGADGYGSANYNQVNLGSEYNLSKRTFLYAFAFYETASGTDSTGHAAVADLSGSSYSSSDRQAAAIVGITHKF
jgi:predicted porin